MEEFADGGVLGEHFRDDVAGAFEGFLYREAEGGGVFEEGLAVGGLFVEIEGEGFEAFFAGDGGFGFAFGLVGEIEVFEFGFFEGFLDFGFEFGGEFALFLDGFEDGGAALFEFAVVFEFFLYFLDLDFVEVAGGFLAVAGDEGDGAAFV
jgi:hypothetical protein